MKELKYKDIKYLKKMAHHLKPFALIGKNGLTESVMASIDKALSDHELIKVKFIDFKKEKREISENIVSGTNSINVGIIGNILILYREHPEKEKRKISLPSGK